MASRKLFGRRVIYTDADTIDATNVVDELREALNIHRINRDEIIYLDKYYRGDQPIWGREKTIRPEICNKIVENRANEIVTFKSGYWLYAPIQYVCRGGKEEIAEEELNMLNEYMHMADKPAKDKELADSFLVCGTAYRMTLPNSDPSDDDDSPFETHVLEASNSFVVYHSGLGHKPKMGVKYVARKDNVNVYSVYTDTWYYEIIDDRIVKAEPHYLGRIPIIEYPANKARLGAFEIVIPILDAINTTFSNRLDGVEQFIQALMIFKGVDIQNKEFEELKEKGGLKIPAEGDVKYLIQELNQMQTQTLVDYMYQTVLTICGMPNRNGGSSTSDTGAAVMLRDGWSAAEARAKDTELMYEAPEKEFLRQAISIMNTAKGTNLKLSSVKIHYARRDYENILEKSQILTTMLNCEKIHPRYAFELCNLFPDPELAYSVSAKYYEERAQKLTAELDALTKHQDDDGSTQITGEEVA